MIRVGIQYFSACVFFVVIAVLKHLLNCFSPQDDKMNRFDLVVINRVFQFSADSLEDSQVWINVLHAAISKFKPQEAKEGGNMSEPDKQGFILKQGHGPFAKFKERQVHSYCQNCGALSTADTILIYLNIDILISGIILYNYVV